VQGGQVEDAIRPFLPLGEKLGRLFTSLSEEGTAGEVTIEFLGAVAEADVRILGLSVLRGMLQAVCHEPVTFVNAPLLAQDRGLSIREVTNVHSDDYVSLVRVSGRDRDGQTVSVAGTIFQPGDRARLVEIWDTAIDVEPTDHMAFFRYDDRPGVIGAVGNAFGDAGVNIASAQVGRHDAGGTAVMALALDDAPPHRVLADLAAQIGAQEARAVHLD
jgi:D-3-phosphoglycerate dehydrogenase / 2-oxoglutarate reductase